MRILHEFLSIPGPPTPIRAYFAMPRDSKQVPGLLFYSDIFQLTPSTLRVAARFAGYGFAVLAPEIYARHVVAGTAWNFDDEGRECGLAAAKATTVAEFDDDARRCIDTLRRHPRVDAEQLGAVGFCLGGHLAFRAAFADHLWRAVCYYPTGLYTGTLGKDTDARSLQLASEIARRRLHLIFGTEDPHVPAEERAQIIDYLRLQHVDLTISTYPAEHAFMRDEGPRFDPEVTDLAFAAGMATLRGDLALIT